MIETLFENSEYLAVNKPSGLSVHNENSIMDKLPKGLLPVHRLDRETSGVLVFAKTSEAGAKLASIFQSHKLTKVYEAVACGAFKSQSGRWEMPITDKAEGFNSPQGKAQDRVAALTEWKVVRSNQFFTQIRIQLHTGRQHQIRKHAVLSGHAVVGDDRYGNQKYNTKISKLYGVHRLMLHACELKFNLDGEEFHLQSKLPKEFALLFPDQ